MIGCFTVFSIYYLLIYLLLNSLFHSLYLVFPKSLFSIADLFVVCYLWVVCNEVKCCVVTQLAADIRFAWLVYVRTYCVLIATLNQNKETRSLYLGDAQIKTGRADGTRSLRAKFSRNPSHLEKGEKGVIHLAKTAFVSVCFFKDLEVECNIF